MEVWCVDLTMFDLSLNVVCEILPTVNQSDGWSEKLVQSKYDPITVRLHSIWGGEHAIRHRSSQPPSSYPLVGATGCHWVPTSRFP